VQSLLGFRVCCGWQTLRVRGELPLPGGLFQQPTGRLLGLVHLA